MSSPITSYYASLSFQVNRASMAHVDKALKQVESRVRKFAQQNQKLLNQSFKNFTLPAMQIKKFKFDELALQRNSQMALNRVSRLLTLPINNFVVDQAKLNKQMQGVMQRAANQAKINVRSIQGSGGGSRPYTPLTPLGARGYASSAGFTHGLAGGATALLPGHLGMFSGPALAVAAPIAAAVGAQRAAVGLGNDQASAENMKAQLDVASGQTTRAGRDKQNKRFFNLANSTGTDASELITSYAQMMKTLQAIGLSAEKSFDLYKDMSTFAKSTGASGEQQGRAAYAIGQIYGKGYVAREELNLQLADALPSFKKYLKDVYASETGKTSGEDFDIALTKKQISTQMMEQAFRKAAEAGAANVAVYANTVKGEQARLANQKLEEQLSRTMTDDVIPAMRDYTKAQQELYTAMQPLRNAMYEASASILTFSASAIRASSPKVNSFGKVLTENKPLKQIFSDPVNYIPSFIPGVPILQGYRAIQRFQQPSMDNKFISPLSAQKPDGWSDRAEQIKNQAISSMMSTHNNTITNTPTFNNTWNITSTAADAESLASELEPFINNIFNRKTDTLLGQALLMYPNKE